MLKMSTHKSNQPTQSYGEVKELIEDVEDVNTQV